MATRRDSLAARREALGLTQIDLANELGVELSTVGRWERERSTPQPWRRPALARALRVSLDELAELLNPEPSHTATTTGGAQGRASRREVTSITALSAGMVGADHVASQRPNESSRLGSNLRTPSPPSVRSASRQVAELHRAYQAARYAEVRRVLPSVTETVDELVPEQTAKTSRNVLEVQCNLHIAAAKLEMKAGNHATAWAAAEEARTVAEAAEDTFGQAAAAYQRACALMRAGDIDNAEQVAASTADSVKSRDPHSLTWRGALTLISAIIAARRNDGTEATHRLDHAEELAWRLGADYNIGWTAFGPTNVMIHRVSVAVSLEDPYAALERADELDITRMPVGLRGRQAQFHLDNAWAHTQLGEAPEAVIHLLDTERVAPELVRANPDVHRLLQQLLTRERRYRVPGLHGLVQRAGVPV